MIGCRHNGVGVTDSGVMADNRVICDEPSSRMLGQPTGVSTNGWFQWKGGVGLAGLAAPVAGDWLSNLSDLSAMMKERP